MNKRAAIVPIALVVFGSAYAWYYYAGNASNINGLIEGSGTIEAIELNIGSQIASEVKSIKTEEGKAVKKGEILVVLDDRLLGDQVLSAEAGVDAAKAAIDDADTTAEKNITKAQLKQAEAALSIAKTQRSYATVKSPINGVVLSLPYGEGEVAGSGATLAVIGKTTELDLTVYVDEKELGKIKTGQKAKINVDAYPDETFSGRLIEIASDAEFTPQNVQTKEQRSNLVFAATIRVNNADGKLKPGMPADAVLE